MTFSCTPYDTGRTHRLRWADPAVNLDDNMRLSVAPSALSIFEPVSGFKRVHEGFPGPAC